MNNKLLIYINNYDIKIKEKKILYYIKKLYYLLVLKKKQKQK